MDIFLQRQGADVGSGLGIWVWQACIANGNLGGAHSVVASKRHFLYRQFEEGIIHILAFVMVVIGFGVDTVVATPCAWLALPCQVATPPGRALVDLVWVGDVASRQCFAVVRGRGGHSRLVVLVVLICGCCDHLFWLCPDRSLVSPLRRCGLGEWDEGWGGLGGSRRGFGGASS